MSPSELGGDVGALLEGARRVGLFGGSFDPIHAGHLHAARAARRAFDLERVLFVPAARSPFKQGVGRTPAPARDRLAMVALAIAGEPAFRASALELERPGPSYTVDTVRALAQALPRGGELFLVLGSDQLAGLPGWREIDWLLAAAQPIVVPRGGLPGEELARLSGRLAPASLAALRRGLLAAEPLLVASTDVREGELDSEALARALPPAVLAYARERGLYGLRT